MGRSSRHLCGRRVRWLWHALEFRHTFDTTKSVRNSPLKRHQVRRSFDSSDSSATIPRISRMRDTSVQMRDQHSPRDLGSSDGHRGRSRRSTFTKHIPRMTMTMATLHDVYERLHRVACVR
ncbi:uncharacterized protein LOC112590414 [Harpegnathos saltator]|uniref:uncharacterized protein LOC112590414 n=1 Tax=Harpegnathos saltator TaxID=610380 RepID=UPI000DBEDE95|nr:uncharacterized protein LOC112590414 [Harpegnathos saltator]